jgi:hypothetical protein
MRDTIRENWRFLAEPASWPAKEQAVSAVEANLQRALTLLLTNSADGQSAPVQTSMFAHGMQVDEFDRRSFADDEDVARKLQLQFEEEEKQQQQSRQAEEAATHLAFVHDQTHCAICDKQHQIAEMCFLERCSHCVCRVCMHNYIMPKVEAKCCLEHQVLCPLEHCQTALTTLDIKNALKQQDYEAYLNTNLQLVIDSDAKFVRCPHEGCGVVIERVSALNGTIKSPTDSPMNIASPGMMVVDPERAHPQQHLPLRQVQYDHQVSMSPMVVRSPGAAAAAAAAAEPNQRESPEANDANEGAEMMVIGADANEGAEMMVIGADGGGGSGGVQLVQVFSASVVVSRHKQE